MMAKILIPMFLLTSLCSAEEPLTIPLHPGRGTEMLAGCEHLDKFWTLMRYYESQITSTYCGVATAAIILNALDIPDPSNRLPSARYGTQEHRFFTEAVNAIIDIESVKNIGMTLHELKAALQTFGVHVQLYSATDIDADAFRDLLLDALAKPNTHVVINYGRKELGETGTGHISPIGAYNPIEDRALILDVNRRRLPPVWAQINSIHTAMNTLDCYSGLPRGFLIVSAD